MNPVVVSIAQEQSRFHQRLARRWTHAIMDVTLAKLSMVIMFVKIVLQARISQIQHTQECVSTVPSILVLQWAQTPVRIVCVTQDIQVQMVGLVWLVEVENTKQLRATTRAQHVSAARFQSRHQRPHIVSVTLDTYATQEVCVSCVRKELTRPIKATDRRRVLLTRTSAVNATSALVLSLIHI